MAPATGQVHSPSTSTSRTPADSSQRRIFSVSSAVAAGAGPGRGAHGLGAAAQLGDVVVGVGAGRDDAGGGEPAVADDVDRPAAVVLAAGGDDLGAAGERREPLRAGSRPDERGEPVAVDAGLLEALVVGQRGHPPVDRPRRRRRGCGSRVSRS